MSVPDIHHWLAGDDFNATRMNEIRDQINWLRNPPTVHVARSITTQTIPFQTWTKVSFDTVVNSYDPYVFFDAGTPDRITITQAGWYTCEIVCSMSSTFNDSRMIMGLYKNGFTTNELLLRYDQTTLPNTGNINMRKETTLFFNVGDWMHLGLYTDDTANRVSANTSAAESSQLRVRWVSK